MNLSLITVIKDNAIDIIQNLGDNSNAGVVVFGGITVKKDIMPVSSETYKAELEDFIRKIDPTGDGPTNLNDGLIAADELLDIANGTKEIIILSDGLLPPDSMGLIKNKILYLRNKNIKIYLVQVFMVYDIKAVDPLYNELAKSLNEQVIALNPNERASIFIEPEPEEQFEEERCSARADEMITITVRSGGTPIRDAEVRFDGNSIGMTSRTGKLDFTTSRTGLHNITVTKSGYEMGIKTVQVLSETTITPYPNVTANQTFDQGSLNASNKIKEMRPVGKEISGFEVLSGILALLILISLRH